MAHELTEWQDSELARALEALDLALKVLRRRSGLTEADVARMIGVSRCTLSRWRTRASAPASCEHRRRLIAVVEKAFTMADPSLWPKPSSQPIDPEAFGRAYDEARQRGLSVDQIATVIGVSRTTLWNWRRYGVPDVSADRRRNLKAFIFTYQPS